MMVAVFAAMTLALVSGWWGRRWLAVLLISISLLLAVGQFLYEIYSPVDGFRMPWIQTQRDAPSVTVIAALPGTAQT